MRRALTLVATTLALIALLAGISGCSRATPPVGTSEAATVRSPSSTQTTSRPAHPVTTTSTTVYPPVPAGTPLYDQGLRLPSALPHGARLRVPILEFHAVAAQPVFGPFGARLTISTAEFEAEMSYLAAQGYNPVTLEDIYAALALLRPLPQKPVALTFDDGYLDDYTVAFPILKAHHFEATFFVVTGVVGRLGYVSWDDLRAMHAVGMAIESHTVTHPNLTLLSASDLSFQLVQSRAAIAAQIGQVPAVLAYPMGNLDPQVEAAAGAAGYLAAVAAATASRAGVVGARNVYAWPRIAIDSPETMANFINALG